MKQFSRIFLALMASLTLSLAGTAAAEHGSSSGSGSSGSGESGSSSSSEVETHNSVTTVSMETETHSGTDDSTSPTTMRQKAQEHVAQLREQHKSKSAEDRQNVCESHKQGLENKFSHIVTNSQRIQDRISGVLDKAVTYKTDKNLDVANYEDLLAKANAAKQTSADAIAALQEVKPSLDCNNTSVATDVATFKEAAKTTRDDLKAYRTAVKDLLKAIRDAKQADNTTAEGSN